MIVYFYISHQCRLLIDKVLPSDNVLLKICEEVKQMLKKFGFEYKSYHIFQNDCILYRGEYEDIEVCPECGHDKYKKSKIKGKAHGPPHKVLKHLIRIPRIQRLFHCKEFTILQGWHVLHRSE